MDRDQIANWAGDPVGSLVQWVYEWCISMFRPSVIQIPDVRHMYVPSARSKLRTLGLRARVIEPEGPTTSLPSLIVAAQEPGPGTTAKRRSLVTLYLVVDGAVEYAS